MADYAQARRNMVDSQIRTNRVVDSAVLAAFAEVPRERFAGSHLGPVAYLDEDLPIGGGRYLVEPMVLARLIQALAIGPAHAVLDVGCGPGYSTAILARLARRVVAVEDDAPLLRRAKELLAELRADNTTLVEGPLAEGQAKLGPYDAILIGGAIAELPRALTDQLAEGGRLATVLGPDGASGAAMLYLKIGGVVSGRPLFDAATPHLPGFQKEAGFVF
jgi:protein-L-isoaspartate(D-aspartate) O-methyltransferase